MRSSGEHRQVGAVREQCRGSGKQDERDQDSKPAIDAAAENAIPDSPDRHPHGRGVDGEARWRRPKTP